LRFIKEHVCTLFGSVNYFKVAPANDFKKKKAYAFSD